MRKINNLFISLLLFFTECKKPVEGEIISIKGNVKNIPAKKVYLTEAHEWEKFLDSAEYRNDTFSFRIRPRENFRPFMASITYFDSIQKKVKKINFKNHILSPGETKYLIDAFYLERGETKMSGVNNSFDNIHILAGRQNDAFFTTQMMNFGYVDQEDKVKREADIKKYKALINKYPSSYYFLGEIMNNRELYSSTELNDYLTLFTSETQNSLLGKNLREYITHRPNFDAGLSNLSLESGDGSKRLITDTTAKLNMLIFWASWCAPCRAEIPQLKKLYEVFKDKGLNISSISIDENKQRWASAVENEKMPWKQFIVDSVNIAEIKYRFDFSAIPFLLILNKKGVPVLRSVGFDPKKTYEQRRNYLDSLISRQ